MQGHLQINEKKENPMMEIAPHLFAALPKTILGPWFQGKEARYYASEEAGEDGGAPSYYCVCMCTCTISLRDDGIVMERG